VKILNLAFYIFYCCSVIRNVEDAPLSDIRKSPFSANISKKGVPADELPVTFVVPIPIPIAIPILF
tara:strand:+ start:307 stop:504 length:198 start_codon:yes stop_codon:yes gene_type:complete